MRPKTFYRCFLSLEKVVLLFLFLLLMILLPLFLLFQWPLEMLCANVVAGVEERAAAAAAATVFTAIDGTATSANGTILCT